MGEVVGSHSSPPPAAESVPDDVLAEILLRLPPHPSFLSQASLVCNRWRRLIHNPNFLRRFRAFHQTPPVLGFFHNSSEGALFVPTEGPPGRIAAETTSLHRGGDDGMWWFVGCRHGRALLRSVDWADVLVWDPMTGERRCITVPNQMQEADYISNRDAAVFCTASGGDEDGRSGPFHVALVFTIDNGMFACVYSLQTGAWGDLISTPTPGPLPCMLFDEPPALVGEALYWLVNGSRIIEFNFSTHSLSLIWRPSEMPATHKWNIRVVSLEDDVLGLAFVKDFTMHLWAREVADDGASNWIPRRAVEMDNVLPPLPMVTEGSRRRRMVPVWISGFSEDGNMVFIGTPAGIFLVWLQTLKFKKVSDESLLIKTIHPYESFYVPNGGGKHKTATVGARLLGQVASEVFSAHSDGDRAGDNWKGEHKG
ncbi:hypothetical protein E2562_019878 [Oryza meyeriana var. granulata]|uniref:F-box domain-containing protein n=1 Tax=Oryza meyeriana var. granulata TaxID=110450 RepID=A0A6G1EXG1_9ORYZ|nr:hypothetical protein E2562_019878 [Oryza meyeriana var. granulata]